LLATTFIAALAGPALAQFETRFDIHDPGEPYSLAVGDFNRDGILDLAVAGGANGRVSVLLGNGDGTFGEPVFYHGGTTINTDGDLRNIGILDLVGTNALAKTIGVMLGNGDGTFGPLTQYPDTKGTPLDVALGDLTNNNIQDVVAIDGGGYCPCISVLLGNGDGTFQRQTHFPAPFPANALVLGDFNRDGNLDMVTVGLFGGNSEFGVLLGNGDGTFTAGKSYPTYFGPQAVVAADFTGHHTLDIAVAAPEGGTISIFLGNGEGSFRAGQTIGASFPAYLVTADFNGDGIADLAVLTGFSNSYVSVFLGNGDGTFQPGIDFPAAQAAAIASGDFNGDVQPDIALGNYLGNSVITLLNTGTVSFSPTTRLNFNKQAIGTTSAPKTVKLTNSGSTGLEIFSMKASAQFGVSSTCGTVLGAGATCNLSITFSPNRKAPNPVRLRLRIAPLQSR
jgi:hypothetical protein